MALLSSAFTAHSNHTLGVVIWMVSKFTAATSYLSLYVYGSEIFPTVSRSACVGGFSFVSRLAASATPIELTLVAVADWLPALTFGVVAMMPALLVWNLESHKVHLWLKCHDERAYSSDLQVVCWR